MTGSAIPVVFCNGTHTIHTRETHEVQKGFEITGADSVELTVDKPSPLLTYAISWMPPD